MDTNTYINKNNRRTLENKKPFHLEFKYNNNIDLINKNNENKKQNKYQLTKQTSNFILELDIDKDNFYCNKFPNSKEKDRSEKEINFNNLLNKIKL